MMFFNFFNAFVTVMPVCWVSLLTTTNHKMVGITYAYMLISIALVFTTLVAMIRLIISVKVVSSSAADIYNTVISIHGVIMVFFYIMPVLIGVVANILLPISIGSIEVAYPKLNNVSMLLWALSVIILLMCGLVNNNVINAGWTLYPPLSTSLLLLYNNGVLMLCILLLVNGTSSNISALNFIVSIYNIGAPGFTLVYVNLYVWVINIIMALLMVVLPVLTGILCMIMADVAYNTVFFDYSIGGDVVLFQHMFWFFGHPEVYVLILPSFGIISIALMDRYGSVLYGANSMYMAINCIAILGLIVWSHHMYTVSMENDTKAYFALVSICISLPTANKIYNWYMTMVLCSPSAGNSLVGRSNVDAVALLVYAFIILFTLGGMGGVLLSNSSIDIQCHDSYFVVGHFHLIVSLGNNTSFVLIIVLYWRYLSGNHLFTSNTRLAAFAVILTLYVVVNVNQHYCVNMPRRYAHITNRYLANQWAACSLPLFTSIFVVALLLTNGSSSRR